MNRLLAGISTAVALTAMVVTAQTTVTGYVLTAPKVDGSTFARDAKMSSFWTDWSNKEQVVMTTAQNGWVDGENAFSDASDAEFKVRAAYDEKALYLFFEITDNLWQPPAGFDADGIDLLLDKISAAEIMNPDTRFDLYIQPSWFWTLTYYSIQYQINIGGANAALASYVNINYFSGSAMTYKRVTLTQLPTEYDNFDLDLAAISPTIRHMEWKIPWTWVGVTPGIGTMPAPGTLIALAGGYNDSDVPTQVGKKCLRWREKDPFNPTNNTFSNAWGDIQIGPNGPGPAVQRSLVTSHAVANATSTQYFTVKGEMLSGSQMKSLRQGTMVVQRAVVNGQNVSKMIRTK